ncbi:MAG TPA: RidA family protein [Acidobacteriota bacterium]|nr:RidA family protein [Acidobacteriota bacterium]
MSYQVINPEQLGVPSGWNHGMLGPAGGRTLFVAGQTARDRTGKAPEAGFVEQFANALDNTLAVVRAAGGGPSDIGRMTVFVTDIDAYRRSLKELGDHWKQRMGRHFPAMALMEVTRLVDERAMVEIEATALLPEPAIQQGDGPGSALA